MDTICLDCLTKTYEEKTICKDLSFGFEKDKFYVIRGRSGCGKTTLLNLIAGYVRPEQGKVRTDAQIGYLNQQMMLFSNLTVEENVRISLYAEEVEETDLQEKLDELLMRFGISELKHNKVACLSGGERRRVELIQMLLKDTKIVLMDEPTAQLDEENAKMMEEIILNEYKGKTVIIVTHENDVFVDHCIGLRLQNGKLEHE